MPISIRIDFSLPTPLINQLMPLCDVVTTWVMHVHPIRSTSTASQGKVRSSIGHELVISLTGVGEDAAEDKAGMLKTV